MLKTRVALITGSTQGIGFAIARKLAAAGLRVIIHGIESENDGERLASEIGDKRFVGYIRADLSNSDEALELIERAEKLFGGVDILVNNAGIQHVSSIEEFTLAKWEKVLAINLTGPFLLMKTCLGGMRTRGWGRIINVASVHGLIGSVNKSAYLAAKHGLVGLTKGVALETATSGITANCICPGFTDTPILEAQIKAKAAAVGGSYQEGVHELLREKQPNMTLLPPGQIAAAVEFLCGDNAAGITGIAMPIDGGWTAQ
jgi:3-hydroxybutyrate dehydrogenase